MRRISLVAALLLSASVGFGQTVLATVTGTISDKTGAVIANAPISLKNVETGQVYSGASSDTGNYTVSQLQIGDYDLTVKSPGFKTYTHTKFHLAAGQTMREDVLLEVGQATESVTVTAESSLLQTESSELVHNVTLSQLDNLPVLQVGATNDGVRDIFGASRLLPGIQYCNTPPFCNAVASAVINGTPANTLQTRLDGATMNPTSTRLGGATMETQPSVEAIQEVAIQTSNFAAEFGTSGGAMVNLVTKSGTNQFHGTAYDYATNEVLNAGQPYTGVRNKLRQHDYGFTFGGPVRIPKVYNGENKTFFFWSFEQFRQTLINNTTPDTVPIPAYRGDIGGVADFTNLITSENRLICTAGAGGSAGNGCGDPTGKSIPYVDPLNRTIQSGTIFDPLTDPLGNGTVRNPFPLNQIPVTRFDAGAKRILALVPQPLGPNALQAGANYLAPIDESRTTNIPSLKIDQNFGSKLHGAFYYQRTNTGSPRTPTAADDLPDNITDSANSRNAARTFRLNLDHTVTPLFLLHYTLGWNDSDFLLGSINYPFDAFQQLGIPGQTAARTFPIINSFTGTSAQGGMSLLGGGFDQHFFERRPSFNVSGTYVRGSHTYKLGFEIRQEKFPNYDSTSSAGSYQTSNAWTTQTSLQTVSGATGFAGFGFSSFLLGGLSGASINAPIALGTSKIQTALFLQDTWKVTRKLTFDYGVRWDRGSYQSEQYGRIANFSPTTPNPAASGRLGARIYEATCGCQFASAYPYAIGPRLGLAYQIDRKTVIRTGFGVVYNATSNSIGGNSNSATAGTPGFGQIVGLLQNGIPSNVVPMWPNFSPNAGQTVGTVVGAPTFLDPNAGRPARLLQWNFTLQREFGRDLVVEAGYVANRGTGWDAGGLSPLNSLTQATLQSYGFNDFTNVNDAKLLSSTLSTVLASSTLKPLLIAHGLNGLPYGNFPTNQTVRQMLLAYPQFSGSISPAAAPSGKTWYDSLQTTVTKRFSHGLSANANYTYSKTLSLLSSPDPFNRELGKNLSISDLPHQFRAGAQYEVPRIHSALPVLKNSVVAYALSGWGMGWALSYQSAPLVGLPASQGATPISQFLGYGPGNAQLKTDPTTGQPMNPWSVDWTDYAGVHHTDPLDINCHCFDPTKNVVLNPAAWQNVPDGQFAAYQSSIRSFRGFRYPGENANFSRNFRFKERVSLNIRVEFTNVFNRTQMLQPTIAGPGVNFNSPPVKFTSGPNIGLYSSGFGTINPTAGIGGFRTGVLVARLQF
jgi:hypothetical protein